MSNYAVKRCIECGRDPRGGGRGYCNTCYQRHRRHADRVWAARLVMKSHRRWERALAAYWPTHMARMGEAA